MKDGNDAMTAHHQNRTASPATERHALLSGGGSGGHVFPGLAIAEELAARGWSVSWAGSRRGPEARLVSRRRITFHDLPARPVVGQGFAGKARAAATLVHSAWRARSLVRRLDARIVVGTGGYASAPAVVGARLAARPAFLIEPNADAGVANRLLSRLAKEAAVAFDETASQLACPSRTTGVPVRSEFFRLAAANDQELPPAPPLRLLVLGGSQGARQINQLVPRALGLLGSRIGALEVCHQTGDAHRSTTLEAYRDAGLADASETEGRGKLAGVPASGGQIRYRVVAFLDRMADAMARSHLIVSRAGAITLAEICACGRPSLLVPLALAAGHQAGNARRLAEAGAAAMLPPAATAEDLAEVLAGLLGDRTRLADMARSARSLGRPDAAAAIADRVEVCAAGAPPARRAGASPSRPGRPRQKEAS